MNFVNAKFYSYGDDYTASNISTVIAEFDDQEKNRKMFDISFQKSTLGKTYRDVTNSHKK